MGDHSQRVSCFVEWTGCTLSINLTDAKQESIWSVLIRGLFRQPLIVLQAAADVDTPKVLAAVAELSLWFKAHIPDLLDVHSAGMFSMCSYTHTHLLLVFIVESACFDSLLSTFAWLAYSCFTFC